MRALVVVAMTLGLLAAGGAAQPALDKPAAEKLFEEGRAALDAGRFDEACAKFEASIRKDPRATGTLLNLALCNERRGRIATALRLYQEAFDRASEANLPGQKKAAQEKVIALSPQVPIVAIHVDGTPLAGTKLVIDDEVVALDAGELPIDPGRHEVVVTAPGRLPFQTVIVAELAQRAELTIPELQRPRTIVKHVGNTRRTFGKVATFGGAGLTAVAGGIALYAYSLYNRQFDGPSPACGGPDHPPLPDGTVTCSSAGNDATTRARSLGTAATVLGGIGVAAAITGVLLWTTAPNDERPTVVPTASADGAGVALVGTF